MQITFNIKKRHLVIILALFLVGLIYAEVGHPWSQVTLPAGGIPASSLNLAGAENQIKVTNPGGLEITLKEFSERVSGMVNLPPTEERLNVNGLFKCSKGYAAYAVNVQSDVPTKIACRKADFDNYGCETLLAGPSKDGGSNAVGDTWNVQCPAGKAITAMSRSLIYIANITCCTIPHGIDTGNCVVQNKNGYLGDALTSYAFVGIYDDDDEFKDIDKAKFCPVSNWNPQ